MLNDITLHKTGGINLRGIFLVDEIDAYWLMLLKTIYMYM